MSYARVAVSGANKGIGLATVRALAQRHAVGSAAQATPTSGSSQSYKPPKQLIYLTSRMPSLGHAAISNLTTNEPSLDPSTGSTDLAHHTLDVSSPSSISAFASHIRSSHPSGLNLLINNAGIAGPTGRDEPLDTSAARNVLETNYYGVQRMCNAFMPLMAQHGRIVNVASTLGKLSRYSPELQARFRRVAQIYSSAGIDSIMEDFMKAVESGTTAAEGWDEEGRGPSAYAVSKAGVVGLTSMLARLARGEEGQGREVTIDCVCPGFLATDLTRGRGSKDVEGGAARVVDVAVNDPKEHSGKFYSRGEVVDW